jgi:hypothetical protein
MRAMTTVSCGKSVLGVLNTEQTYALLTVEQTAEHTAHSFSVPRHVTY